MKIQVTQADIDDGLPSKSCYCPIALAVKRATGVRRVHVAIGTIFLGGGVGEGEVASTPRIAQEFIEAFDACEPVELVNPDGVVVHFFADRHCTRYAEWVEDVPDLSTAGRVNQVRKAVCVGELLKGE